MSSACPVIVHDTTKGFLLETGAKSNSSQPCLYNKWAVFYKLEEIGTTLKCDLLQNIFMKSQDQCHLEELIASNYFTDENSRERIMSLDALSYFDEVKTVAFMNVSKQYLLNLSQF